MLSEDTLKALAEPMAYRLEQFNTYVLKDIGERIKEIGEIKPSDIDKLRKLKRYGADTGSIITELERISKLNARDIEHMLNETAKYNYNSLAALVEAQSSVPSTPIRQAFCALCRKYCYTAICKSNGKADRQHIHKHEPKYGLYGI